MVGMVELMGVAVYQQPEQPASATPTIGGHGRGTTSEKRPPQPRVPIIGVDAGAIPGSKPGGELGAAKYLERCGRDILRGALKRHRRRDYRG